MSLVDGAASGEGAGVRWGEEDEDDEEEEAKQHMPEMMRRAARQQAKHGFRRIGAFSCSTSCGASPP